MNNLCLYKIIADPISKKINKYLTEIRDKDIEAYGEKAAQIYDSAIEELDNLPSNFDDKLKKILELLRQSVHETTQADKYAGYHAKNLELLRLCKLIQENKSQINYPKLEKLIYNILYALGSYGVTCVDNIIKMVLDNLCRTFPEYKNNIFQYLNQRSQGRTTQTEKALLRDFIKTNK